MQLFADRIKETSTSTGTGDFTLAGAASGFRTFSNSFTVSTAGANVHDPHRFVYVIDAGGSWELGIGKLSGASTLVRASVLLSSNANALVDFAAGTKNVFCADTTLANGLVFGASGLGTDNEIIVDGDNATINVTTASATIRLPDASSFNTSDVGVSSWTVNVHNSTSGVITVTAQAKFLNSVQTGRAVEIPANDTVSFYTTGTDKAWRVKGYPFASLTKKYGSFAALGAEANLFASGATTTNSENIAVTEFGDNAYVVAYIDASGNSKIRTYTLNDTTGATTYASNEITLTATTAEPTIFIMKYDATRLVVAHKLGSDTVGHIVTVSGSGAGMTFTLDGSPLLVTGTSYASHKDNFLLSVSSTLGVFVRCSATTATIAKFSCGASTFSSLTDTAVGVNGSGTANSWGACVIEDPKGGNTSRVITSAYTGSNMITCNLINISGTPSSEGFGTLSLSALTSSSTSIAASYDAVTTGNMQIMMVYGASDSKLYGVSATSVAFTGSTPVDLGTLAPSTTHMGTHVRFMPLCGATATTYTGQKRVGCYAHGYYYTVPFPAANLAVGTLAANGTTTEVVRALAAIMPAYVTTGGQIAFERIRRAHVLVGSRNNATFTGIDGASVSNPGAGATADRTIRRYTLKDAW